MCCISSPPPPPLFGLWWVGRGPRKKERGHTTSKEEGGRRSTTHLGIIPTRSLRQGQGRGCGETQANARVEGRWRSGRGSDGRQERQTIVYKPTQPSKEACTMPTQGDGDPSPTSTPRKKGRGIRAGWNETIPQSHTDWFIPPPSSSSACGNHHTPPRDLARKAPA